MLKISKILKEAGRFELSCSTPAYDHMFETFTHLQLDASWGAVSVTERAGYIARAYP